MNLPNENDWDEPLPEPTLEEVWYDSHPEPEPDA